MSETCCGPAQNAIPSSAINEHLLIKTGELEKTRGSISQTVHSTGGGVYFTHVVLRDHLCEE